MQCGAINRAEAHACCFCDARLGSCIPDGAAVPARTVVENPVDTAPQQHRPAQLPAQSPAQSGDAPEQTHVTAGWNNDVAHRLAAYRARREQRDPSSGQPQFAFEGSGITSRAVSKEPPIQAAPAAAPPPLITPVAKRSPRRHSMWEDHLEIDVAQPMLNFAGATQYPNFSGTPTFEGGLRSATPRGSIASLPDRLCAALLDVSLLLLAYGGFLAVFWTLGGHFAASKFGWTLMLAPLGLLYVHYYLLFTILGGATPG